MDVLPRYIGVIELTGQKCTRQRRLERVAPPNWPEKQWDEVIVDNVDLLADALREAEVIGEDSTLRVLGIQVDNIDIVLAEVVADTDELIRVVLLEDKLLRNPQAKRQVLAQILDYARIVQEDWPTANLEDKLKDAEWVHKNTDALKRHARNGEILLLVIGDGIDERLERLASRFAGQDDPLSRSELALVSMPLYGLEGKYLLIPHVVSSVRRSERELTIKVVVENVQGDEVNATLSLDTAEPGSHGLPIKDEVVTFLRRLRERIEHACPGISLSAKPRKSLENFQTGADGEAIYCKVHFGGYHADIWSPIYVGVMIIAENTARRDEWKRRFQSDSIRLPPETIFRDGGPRTVEIQKAVTWTSSSDLNDVLAKSLADDFISYYELLQAHSTPTARS
jgi:hypothetical protein